MNIIIPMDINRVGIKMKSIFIKIYNEVLSKAIDYKFSQGNDIDQYILGYFLILITNLYAFYYNNVNVHDISKERCMKFH